jgi:serine/threonine-protein kinase
VIIRPDGRAALVDFGLVKLWDPGDPRTKTAMRGMGTPEYAPPEQYDIEMGHTDARSDVYGLGATLYHALTGQAPPTATMRMADPEQFAPPRAVTSGVSKQTEAVVLKALELARSQRWQSAGEMAQALETTSLPSSAQPPGRAAPAIPRRGRTKVMPGAPPTATAQRKRVPVWAWALGGLAVLALVVGVVGGGRGRETAGGWDYADGGNGRSPGDEHAASNDHLSDYLPDRQLARALPGLCFGPRWEARGVSPYRGGRGGTSYQHFRQW